MILEHSDRLAQPDGFIGAVFAVEGIADAATLLNGPTGCKFFLGEMSKDQYRREKDFNLMRHAEEFYFLQDRVPCTYLDDYDYVFGASEKLEYVFGRVAGKGPKFLGVINSPGASLIGDDLERYIRWAGLTVPWITLDVPNFSHPFAEGWAEGCAAVVEAIGPEACAAETASVNLLGLTIWHRHWSGSLKELKRLLKLCGIGTQAALGASSTVEDVRGLRKAKLNVIVHAEGGLPLAEVLKERYGIPHYASPDGAPLGFAATETWLRGVCEALGVDPSPGLADLGKKRDRGAEKLYRFNSKSGLPKGVSFGVALDASLALPITRFARDFLGMQPQAVQVPEESSETALALRKYLEEAGCPDAWNAPLEPESPPAAVFSDDAVILRCASKKRVAAGLDLAMPAKDRTNFLEKSVLGGEGSLWILQSLVDDLWRMVDVDP